VGESNEVNNTFTDTATVTAPVVSVAVSPASVLEDGATNVTYTFTRTGNLCQALTVNFTVSGTADAATDYALTGADSFVSRTGTLTFAANSSTATVTIDPMPDSTFEPNETAIVT